MQVAVRHSCPSPPLSWGGSHFLLPPQGMLIPPHGAEMGGKLPPQNFDFPPSIISDGGEGTCFPPKMVAKKSNIFLLPPPLGEGEITENAQFFALPPHNGNTKSQNFRLRRFPPILGGETSPPDPLQNGGETSPPDLLRMGGK